MSMKLLVKKVIKRNPHLKCLILFLVLFLNQGVIFLSAQVINDSINDGPYFYVHKKQVSALIIQNGLKKEEQVTQEKFGELSGIFGFKFDYEDLLVNHQKKLDYSKKFMMVDSIAVLSDIHGEYDCYIDILKIAGIINEDLSWKFGRGHLVILGDIFDRGEMVTEILWHLYGLEKQADNSGGKVHILVGNHEMLVLSGNQDYLCPKYRQVETISGISYKNLYAQNTVLGNWLRSWPVVITINDILFVHGGLSPELVQNKISVTDINRIFTEKIIGKSLSVNRSRSIQTLNKMSIDYSYSDTDMALTNDNNSSSVSYPENRNSSDAEFEKMALLSQNNGPLWYRGYFNNAGIHEKEIDLILDFYNKKHIVVGHTSLTNIQSLFETKIIGIDASQESNMPSQMLLYLNGSFFKYYLNGRIEKL